MSSDSPRHPDRDGALRSWFLGPRAENAELFERLMTEALRDHVFWRRNHHPEDGFTIREHDKRTAGYEEAVATLTQELLGLLARFKRDIPFFSGRYKGHMIYQQTIASQIGYFAAMLYNPNNVASEASPVTTRLELEVAAQLARMIGYEPARSWGHLTSGGTVANFEALWIARNIHYLALAAHGAADALGLNLEVERPEGGTAPLASLDLWELLNATNGAALDLWDALWRSAPAADVRQALGDHSLSALGYQDYGLRLARHFGDPLKPAVVLVSSTVHYSWAKIARALGIGANQLRYVPIDRHFRMDPDALWDSLIELHAERRPVLGCVSVCGTTEESAVDRLDRILEVRRRAEQELGMAFHVHSDACYGGYAAALAWRADGTRRPAGEIQADLDLDWPDHGWCDAMAALGAADSVSIDPHKLGYVPYPAGAFLLEDRRGRDLVAVDPPYLVPPRTALEGDGEERFIGRFILEGSKPGAAAAAVWLSHKVLPLDERGYGWLVGRTMSGARRLHAALSRASITPFRVVLLPAPDINLVCCVVHHPSATTLEAVNQLNEAIYTEMSPGGNGDEPDYYISRTRFQSPMYDGAIEPILTELGVGDLDSWRASGAEGLVVLRFTVMDPFLCAPPPAPDHVSGFITALGEAARSAVNDPSSSLQQHFNTPLPE